MRPVILRLEITMLISIVAFPCLKLYQRGSKDGLAISDGITSIFISLLDWVYYYLVVYDLLTTYRPLHISRQGIIQSSKEKTRHLHLFDYQTSS